MKIFEKVDIITVEAADQLAEQILLCSPESTVVVVLTFFCVEFFPLAFKDNFAVSSETMRTKIFCAYKKALTALRHNQSTYSLIKSNPKYGEMFNVTYGGILIPAKDTLNFDWENGSFFVYSGSIGVCCTDTILDHEIAIKGLKKWAQGTKFFKC